MTVENTRNNFGALQENKPEVSQKYGAALSLANTLAETEETDVTPQRITMWRQEVLFEWLEKRWGYEWNGEEWQE